MECWCSGYDALVFVFAGWALAMITLRCRSSPRMAADWGCQLNRRCPVTIKDVFRLLNTMRSETKEWQRTVNGRFSAIEQGITALRADNLALSRAHGNVADRLDGFETRLNRIEARLELADVPAE